MKKMILVLAMLLVGATAAYAGSGSVVVPGIRAAEYSATNAMATELYITNVSQETVTCTVTPYDQEGSDMSSHCTVYKASLSTTGYDVVATGTGTFTLEAGKTRLVIIGHPALTRALDGNAVIEWASTDAKVKTALIVAPQLVLIDNNVGQGRTILPVIGHQPF